MNIIDPRMIEQDKEVEALIKRKDELEAELKKMKEAAGAASWLTSCRASSGFTINLQIAKLPQVIEFTSYLLRLKNDWIAGAEVLGLTPNELKKIHLSDKEKEKLAPTFENFPIEDWIKDCIQRKKRIEINALEDKISKVNQALEHTKSEVQKRQDEIEKIKKLLG